MDIQTYLGEMEVLKQRHDKEIKKLKREYALTNNPIKIGDIVTDGYSTVKVEKIVVYLNNPPCCVYRGPELNKNKTVKKNGKITDIYQTNLISKA